LQDPCPEEFVSIVESGGTGTVACPKILRFLAKNTEFSLLIPNLFSDYHTARAKSAHDYDPESLAADEEIFEEFPAFLEGTDAAIFPIQKESNSCNTGRGLTPSSGLFRAPGVWPFCSCGKTWRCLPRRPSPLRLSGREDCQPNLLLFQIRRNG